MLNVKETENLLHFDQIKDRLKFYLSTPYGINHIEELQLIAEEKILLRRLKIVDEINQILTKGFQLPAFHGSDLSGELQKLEDLLHYWEGETFLNLIEHLIFYRDVLEWIKKHQCENFKQWLSPNKIPFHLQDIIGRHLNEKGEILDKASTQLQHIRQQKANLVSNIEKKLFEVLKYWKDRQIIEENVQPTLRKGRMVIPVPPHKKSLTRSIVIDVSATGQTLFVEPQAIYQLNNQLQMLESEERKEMIKILSELTSYVRKERSALETLILDISWIDFFFAAARMAFEQKAVLPQISHEKILSIKNARHPLLEMVLKQKGKTIVPLTLTLGENYKLLVISGPNAGGKSVVIKTVGLLQLMLQCGLLVPCDGDSQFPLFSQILVDIGDRQSIENDLSTFTSRLIRMKEIYEHSDQDTLVLIDEVATGTEPEIGAKLAEAYLEILLKKDPLIIVTTHFEHLKMWASSQQGAINATMLFDHEKLEPTYEFFIGLPGSSYGLEIASKIEFPTEIIQLARSKTNPQQDVYTDMFQQLIAWQKDLEQRKKQIEVAEQMVADLIKEYQELNRKLQERKELIIHQAEREAQRLLANAQRLIERTIREVKENALNKEKTKSIRKNFEQEKSRLFEKPPMQLVHEPLRPLEQEQLLQIEFHPGDRVRIKETQHRGEIISIEKNVAHVEMNGFIMEVSIKELEKIDEPNVRRSSVTSTSHVVAFIDTQVDVRGMRVEEALQEVDRKIDRALLNRVPFLQIIHGKGYGILKKAIRDYLRQYQDILDISFPSDANEDGFTMVHFK
ncbi:MAG: Smr/MutS family protein [Bacteroidales bacterium]|nr:Smr/MutS family protein [Bacteroidales bacterium]